jgi:hypothetical protein
LFKINNDKIGLRDIKYRIYGVVLIFINASLTHTRMYKDFLTTGYSQTEYNMAVDLIIEVSAG